MAQGSFTALITPFDEKNQIDYKTFGSLIERQIEAKTDGLILAGSTGEGTSLSLKEKEELLVFALRISSGKIPIFLSTGSNCTATAVEATRRAKELGAFGCLSIVPYYNRPTPEGCIAHFKEISKVGLPLIPYHHPARTGVFLSAKHLIEISKIPGVVAIKECSGSLALAVELINSSSCPIFAGDDLLALPFISVGATGVIGVIGNLLPIEWNSCIKTALSGNFKEAREELRKLLPAILKMNESVNPLGIKALMSEHKKSKNNVRLPLIAL